MGEMSPNFILQCRGSGARWAIAVASAVAFLAGCSTYDSLTQRVAQSITPYRITVVQGNFVSKEAAANMRVGMTRTEVKSALGTPLLTDMFHANRWDYLFYFKRGSTSVVQQRDFVVHFKDDHVVSWQGGDDLPSELELLADIDGDKRGRKAKARAKAAVAASEAAASAAAASAPMSAKQEANQPAGREEADERDAGRDANEQAAQAANRAVNRVQAPQSRTPAASVSGWRPPGVPGGVMPQFHFQRQPQPARQDQSEPVGPTGPQSGNASAQPNQAAGAAQDKQALGG